VVGVDFSAPMLARASQCAREAGLDRVSYCQADGERLPLANHSIQVALMNGIFNLNPNRAALFRELGRVVRPTGVAYAAELVLREPLPPDQQQSDATWFA